MANQQEQSLSSLKRQHGFTPEQSELIFEVPITEVQRWMQEFRNRVRRRQQWDDSTLDDLQQAVWIKVLRRRVAFQRERSRPKTFFNRIANGEYHRFLEQQILHRARFAQFQPEQLEQQTDPTEDLDTLPTDLTIRELFNRCSPFQKQLISGFMQGETETQLSRKLNLPKSRIRKSISIIRKRLRSLRNTTENDS